MIPFLQLTPGPDRAAIAAAIARVIDRGWFILGPELEQLREGIRGRDRGHVTRSVSATAPMPCAIALRAAGMAAGDEVITSPLSAAYTALAIMMVGARPVFADIDPVRLTLDPQAVAAAVTSRTAAIIPVHLYGQAADMDGIAAVATRHRLAIIEDCCQAHLATCGGRPVGSFGVAAAYSFYPTKNLGALGDGGALTTNDDRVAAQARRLRNGGQTDRYHHAEFGVNSRLDEMQAAVLAERLRGLAEMTRLRRALAARYRADLTASTRSSSRPNRMPVTSTTSSRFSRRIATRSRVT